jgi:multicomponent Na+:H+ antiporter subunit G
MAQAAMNLADAVSIALLGVGAFFFAAGTAGLLRFPDVYSRLHAVTKVDNLGLGFVIMALMFQADSWLAVLKLGLIWLLALATAATAGYLVANSAARTGTPAVVGDRSARE